MAMDPWEEKRIREEAERKRAMGQAGTGGSLTQKEGGSFSTDPVPATPAAPAAPASQGIQNLSGQTAPTEGGTEYRGTIKPAVNTAATTPNVATGTLPTWEGGPEVSTASPTSTGLPEVQSGLNTQNLPELSQGLNTQNFADFDQDFAQASQQAADDTYAGLTQYMDEDFGTQEDQARNRLINQGLQPGTEAYNREMSLMQRGHNDARMQAAFQAGQVGHQRAGDYLMRALDTRRLQAGEAGQDAGMRLAARGAMTGEQGQNAAMNLASRGALMGEREREADRLHGQSMGAANLALGARGQNMGREAAMAGVSAQAAASSNAAASQRYATDTQRDLALRNMGLTQDSQDFQQLMALLGGARGGVNMPNFGGTSPLDVGGANQIANQNQNNILNRQASDRAGMAGLGAAALGAMGNYFTNGY